MGKFPKFDPKKNVRRKRTARLILLLCALLLGTITWSVISLPPPVANFFEKQIAANQPAARFGLCFTGPGIDCVVDGDTFWMDGEKIRIADIDAPETHPPRCASEAELGNRATERLQELLNGGPIVLVEGSRDQDIYGRKLRIVTRDGASLGEQLVRERLARTWTGSRQPWC
jgi:endonuclease YncB( thermonuclease family)